MRILVTDDDPSILSLMEVALPALGFPDVDLAESAEEALEAIELAVAPFDCLLLDIQMPGISGIELVTQLRATETYRNVPIFMITAMSGRSYIEAAFRAGANDYFVKPFDMDDLKGRLTLVRDRLAQREGAEAEVETPFGAALHFPDVPGMMPTEQLAAFMRQLGNFDRMNTTAVSISLPDAELLHQNLPAAAFVSVMREAALALERCLSRYPLSFSYVGSGVFCVVSDTALLRDRDSLLPEVERELSAVPLPGANGVPAYLRSDMGRVFRMKFAGASAAEELLDEVLDDARTRQRFL